jgi:uncharacterized protein with HEPN domain
LGERLRRHLTGVSRDGFASDQKTQDAVSRCIAVLGEAAARLIEQAPALDARFPDLELRAARATRNRLLHAYFDIDLEILWRTAHEDVPPMVDAAARIVAERGKR